MCRRTSWGNIQKGAADVLGEGEIRSDRQVVVENAADAAAHRGDEGRNSGRNARETWCNWDRRRRRRFARQRERCRDPRHRDHWRQIAPAKQPRVVTMWRVFICTAGTAASTWATREMPLAQIADPRRRRDLTAKFFAEFAKDG